MQIICSGVDGIKVQLLEAIMRYWTRISENGLYGAAMRLGCSCENRFVSKRWHPLKEIIHHLHWLFSPETVIDSRFRKCRVSPHSPLSELCLQLKIGNYIGDRPTRVRSVIFSGMRRISEEGVA